MRACHPPLRALLPLATAATCHLAKRTASQCSPGLSRSYARVAGCRFTASRATAAAGSSRARPIARCARGGCAATPRGHARRSGSPRSLCRCLKLLPPASRSHRRRRSSWRQHRCDKCNTPSTCAQVMPQSSAVLALACCTTARPLGRVASRDLLFSSTNGSSVITRAHAATLACRTQAW
jgi:hypothetical protein